MAIIQEHFSVGERDFIRTYSDAGFYIHGGSPEADYSEATDPADLQRSYTETDILVESDAPEAEEILSILLGGDPA